MYTFAISGDATDPCGVPLFVSDHWPSSDTPAFSHFWIRRSILGSATRCAMNSKAHSDLMPLIPAASLYLSPTTGRLPILPPSAISGSGEVSSDRLPDAL